MAKLVLGEDGGGARYFLDGRPVHAGDLVEVCWSDVWHPVRFEWTGLLDDPVRFYVADRDVSGRLPAHVELRWPKRA